MESFKKPGENKNKLRKIYPKYHENFKNSKSRAQIYWFLQKRVYCNLHYYKRLVPKVYEYFSVMISGNDCKYYNLIES